MNVQQQRGTFAYCYQNNQLNNWCKFVAFFLNLSLSVLFLFIVSSGVSAWDCVLARISPNTKEGSTADLTSESNKN